MMRVAGCRFRQVLRRLISATLSAQIPSSATSTGVIADGLQSEMYCSELSGSAFGFAINSGRIAAENAARYIGGNY